MSTTTLGFVREPESSCPALSREPQGGWWSVRPGHGSVARHSRQPDSNRYPPARKACFRGRSSLPSRTARYCFGAPASATDAGGFGSERFFRLDVGAQLSARLQNAISRQVGLTTLSAFKLHPMGYSEREDESRDRA